MIGFEAVEPSLMLEWVQAGHLPNFARFMSEGAFGLMHSPAEVSSGGTWSSINCGVKPGKHGIGFCHRQLRSGTYDVRKKKSGRTRTGAVLVGPYQTEDAKFLSSTYPKCASSLIFNGVQITGWGLECKSWETASVPQHLIGEIDAEVWPQPDRWLVSTQTRGDRLPAAGSKFLSCC